MNETCVMILGSAHRQARCSQMGRPCGSLLLNWWRGLTLEVREGPARLGGRGAKPQPELESILGFAGLRVGAGGGAFAAGLSVAVRAVAVGVVLGEGWCTG